MYLGASPPRLDPAWPAPTHACSCPGPPRVESPARSRARRRPLPARARPARPGETDSTMAVQAPRQRQTKGMRQLVRQRQSLVEAGQGLLRVSQQREGHRGIDAAGNPRILAHAERRSTALVWRVAGDAVLQVLARQQATHLGRTRSTRRAWWAMTARAGSWARCARRSNVSPSLARRVQLWPYRHKTATAHTGPGQALASRPPADTTRGPGCRPAPPQALHTLWPSAVPHRGRCAGSRRAGYAQASLAAS